MNGFDDFSRPMEYISPLDRHFRSVLRRYIEQEVMPFRRQYDEDWKDHAIIEPAFDKLMGELGLQKALFPPEHGGWGITRSDYIFRFAYMLCEELGRADTGMAVALAVTFWPLLVILVEPFVNERLIAEFAPMFCNTKKAVFAANAMTEPQGGSDIENMGLLRGRTIRTTARLEGDQWVINGHKLWPTNSGGAASLFGVPCTTRPGSDDLNDFAFIYVPAGAEGVTQGGPYEKAGMAADKNGDIFFDHVRVPAWYRAHGPGSDAEAFYQLIPFGQVASSAFLTGAMMNMYERLNEFVSSRTYRNRPLKENDAVAAIIGRIAGDIDICRILGHEAAMMGDRRNKPYGLPLTSEELVGKIRNIKDFISDRAVENFGKAMDVLGLYGPDRDWDIEKHWRDIKIIQLWMGGKQLCQMESARYFFNCETV
ncbi:MAG: Acyl-CoA dehydrogenase [Deltaproteobacteria bacterium ADurb.BinA179]|jgi:alkylation response protein AidB-like acyl-CoA dehydrogenase|nr:acyl-CoA/acyl-ACP dehydrogenase [Deltaproteobacteria bacterium]MDI9544003.1 acyl-CoA dehydrogenase family protein [Pseudomonadota bacterium]OPZ27500.1 MAG: Acyl-CoA dehydrogenase [Deltaproteobacteria bacterium ADurb.BinA179]HOD70631.1 acyl-CoA dehydrogenase family protein [Deltaproteobacteria bacterium]HOE73151.1 acyl-CoA dehydrogenase family protein [Deltaproteobacteria bacterium]